MIASLPMYDWPQVRVQTDAFWALLRDAMWARGIKAPQTLTRDADPDTLWQNKDLLFSQTCGLPFVASLRDHVALVGTPHYDCFGCEGPDYASVLIAAKDAQATTLAHMRGARAGVNDTGSQSGYSALRAVVAPLARHGRFFADVVHTGGHRQSIAAVANGDVDVAAVDPVCWALAERHDPEKTAALKVIGLTPKAPTLPYVTAIARSPSQINSIRDVLRRVVGSPAFAPIGRALFIKDVECLPAARYQRIHELAIQAAAYGYAEVA